MQKYTSMYKCAPSNCESASHAGRLIRVNEASVRPAMHARVCALPAKPFLFFFFFVFLHFPR